MHVNSVRGPLDPADLGKTLVHEHLRIRSELVSYQFPHVYDDRTDFDVALAAVRGIQSHGVSTLCDPTIPGLGRDVRFVQKVVDETDMQVVMGTGLYTFGEIGGRFQTRDVAYLADLLTRDIEVGMQGTSVKAGFLKCVSDAEGVTPDIEKTIRAVARAHLRTGVPIMTHSHPSSENGFLQLDILEEEGVKARSVNIGHSGDTDDTTYLIRLLDRGVFLGLDRFGLTDTISAAQRNATVLALIEAGFVDRLLLSQDYCCSIEHAGVKEQNETWSMTVLFEEVVPALQSQGVTDAQVHTMLVDNVQSWFVDAAKSLD